MKLFDRLLGRTKQGPEGSINIGIRTLPLRGPLQHLEVRYHVEHLAAPAELSRSTKLMQGDREILKATGLPAEAALALFRKTTIPTAGPRSEELEELRKSLPDWPRDLLIVLAGLSAFGDRDDRKAAACCVQALNIEPACTLAFQLLKLISAKSEVRCTTIGGKVNSPDVPAILSAEPEPDEKTLSAMRRMVGR